MPKLPPSIKRKKLIRALRRLGFVIDESKGDGSHYKIYSLDKTRSSIIPKKLEGPSVRKSIEDFVEQDIGDIQKLIDEL